MKNGVRIVLCAPPRCSCPILNICTTGDVVITDDYNGEVKLTYEEMDILVEQWEKHKC